MTSNYVCFSYFAHLFSFLVKNYLIEIEPASSKLKWKNSCHLATYLLKKNHFELDICVHKKGACAPIACAECLVS